MSGDDTEDLTLVRDQLKTAAAALAQLKTTAVDDIERRARLEMKVAQLEETIEKARRHSSKLHAEIHDGVAGYPSIKHRLTTLETRGETEKSDVKDLKDQCADLVERVTRLEAKRDSGKTKVPPKAVLQAIDIPSHMPAQTASPPPRSDSLAHEMVAVNKTWATTARTFVEKVLIPLVLVLGSFMAARYGGSNGQEAAQSQVERVGTSDRGLNGPGHGGSDDGQTARPER